MKYLKITVIVFVFVTLIQTILAGATVKGIAGLEIPSFGGLVTTNEVIKENFGPQKFELIKCEESVTGKETPVKVRTYRVNYMDLSSWTQLVKGNLVNIAPEHTEPVTYKLKLRAVSDGNWLTSSLYGTWVLG